MTTYLIKTNHDDTTIEAETIDIREGIAYFLGLDGECVGAWALRNITYEVVDPQADDEPTK